MTDQCRYILKCCKKLNEDDFSYNPKDHYLRKISSLTGGVQVAKYDNEANSALEWLHENGYLHKTQFGYSLTQKGLHPYHMIWEEIRHFLIKSIIIPIIVSAVTAIITLWIKSQLKLP